MKFFLRLVIPFASLISFTAQAADITGDWTATITTAVGQKNYKYVFRQDGGKLIGTVTSQDGIAAISDGYINYRTVTFREKATVQGQPVVLEYTGELVSDTEIRFERQVAGTQYPVVEFVATRISTP